VEQLDFPLVVRGREPGDRVRTAGGTKKLKKLLLEARTPPVHRDSVPVVADGSGTVLWVPGVVRTSVIDERGTTTLTIGISG
jgi:tRNA(Ile)-lysidine synthase